MRTSWKRRIKKLFTKPDTEIAPDEIFLDSSNLPDFDRNQFEGRIEKPIAKSTVFKLGVVFVIIFAVLLSKVWALQVEQGQAFTIQSEINRLNHGLIFSERGIIFDRAGTELAWNLPSEEDDFSRRKYIDEPGFSHLLGYVGYPLKDASGVYYQEEYLGIEGVEHQYDDILGGDNGLKIIETNALGVIQTESVIRPPRDGESVTLSIDAELQTVIHNLIADIAWRSGFDGGAAVIMDVESGEILTLTSYPEYDSNVLAEGAPQEKIAEYVANENTPFLNRVISGLYTPGSIVKPFIAIGALQEEVINDTEEILSTGALTIPNPFLEGAVSTFRDNKAHGYVAMREAIAVSSNVYFYEVGGGFEDREGLGIENIEAYLRMFGVGNVSNIDLPAESIGIIPNPSWKEENFPGDVWRIGDTYNTSIGQYGFQITPIQMVRAIAAIANGGALLEPSVLQVADDQAEQNILVDDAHFAVVREGMRQAVTDINGTGVGLQLSELAVAVKTGTAQVGPRNEYVNSWTVGFFPYDKPKYAFAVLMERAPSGTLTGSVAVSRNMLQWIIENKPEYTGLE